MADEWQIRPYEPRDLDGLVYLWMKSFAHSSFGRARGAHIDGSEGEVAYWKAHRDLVVRLLEGSDTRVMCDPVAPEVIWAFVCAKGDVVHYGVVKRRMGKAYGADAMFQALLAERLERPCEYTHDLQGTGIPVVASWKFNPYLVVSE